MAFVFVYGSLKRGLCNHRLMREAEFRGNAVTVSPAFRMGNVGQYPEITRTQDAEAGYVLGEVYACSPSLLEELDKLECNGEWYQREKIQLRITDAKEPESDELVVAWVYLWLKPRHPDVKPVRFESGLPVYEWRRENELM